MMIWKNMLSGFIVSFEDQDEKSADYTSNEGFVNEGIRSATIKR